MIIYSGLGGGTSIISKFLSLKLIVYTGLISYSLYLWHWPLIAFAKYLLLDDSLTTLEISGIILATFIISALSLKYIEQPFRGNQPIIPDRKKLFALSAIVMVIASIIGSVIHFQNGMPGLQSEAEAAKTDPQRKYFEDHGPTLDCLKKGVNPSVIGLSGGVPCFAIWGDSHAGALLTAASEMGKKYGLSGFNLTNGNSPPLLGIDVENNNNHVYSDEVLSFIKTYPKVKTIILAGIWGALENGHRYHSNAINLRLKDAAVDSYYSQPVTLKNGLTRTVNTLLSLGRQVIIVSDIPEIGYPVVRLFWLTKLLGKNIDNYLPTITDYHHWNKNTENILLELSRRPNVFIIHPESMMFDHGGRAMIMANKHFLYLPDGDHLSTEGSRFVSPVFDEAFKKMANSQ